MTTTPNTTVEGWMTRQPHTIGDDQPLASARERMHSLNVRHLAVLHGGHLVGVISSRDIALVESLPGTDLAEVSVSEAMTAEPWTVTASTELSAVASEMAKRRIGTALVVESAGSDSIVGVFTTTDALRALAAFAN